MSKIIPITLKEYEETKPGDLNSKDILEVEKINKLLKVDIFDIKAKNIIKAKQFVGIIKINNKNIQILPKIFSHDKINNQEDKKKDKHIIKNLLHMLSYTKKLKIKESDIAKLGDVNNLFEVYIYIFARDLIELLKKDFKKNYNIIEENSSFLKGKLLFSKHIKNNLFNKSKFFIQYEKMDENILLNIFLNSVCNKLIKSTKSKTNYKLLNKCNFILKDIDNKIFKTPTPLNTLNFNKQNIEYKNIFSLGKMLYFGNSPDFSNSNESNFSLLFDMNILFEEFVVEFMKNNKEDINKDIINVNSQVSSKFVFKDKKFNLKPDILLKYNNDEILVIDTKYKKLSDKTNSGVSSQDIYQMFVYGMRYFGNYDIDKKKNIILLYPDYDGVNYDIVHSSEENINIFIKTINMNFDLSCNEGKEKLIKEIQSIINIS